MEVLLIGGAVAIVLYNSFYTPPAEPDHKDGNREGNYLPAPKFLYSDPAIWTSSPVDVSYRPFIPIFGPNNDPRRNYLLYGGARVTHSGYNPVVQTNQVWPMSNGTGPSGNPTANAQPVVEIGGTQTVTSKTVFKS